MSGSNSNFSHPQKYQTTFFASVIFAFLNLIEDAKLEQIKQNIDEFLLREQNNGSFNYWQKASQQRMELPYPDDLDDTVLAWSAINEYDPKALHGDLLAKIMRLLIASEEKTGGPYKTWLAADKNGQWSDIDLAVNANIAYFLKLYDVNLKDLNHFFESKIKDRVYFSKYYAGVWPVLFFLSRVYNGSLLKRLFADVNSRPSHNLNILELSLKLHTLINLGEKQGCAKLFKQLLKLVQKKNAFRAFPFCIDPTLNGRKHFGGSAALTAVVCLTALQRYNHREDVNLKEDKFYNSVVKKVHEHFQSLPMGIKSVAEKALNELQKNDKTHQIILVNYWFAKGLNYGVDMNTVFALSVANVYGWIAYGIYDDFLDNEDRAQNLPLANICLMHLARIYSNIKNQEVQQLFFDLMKDLELANYAEVTSRLFKNQVDLNNKKAFYVYSRKSLGHALGPLSQCLLMDSKRSSKEFKIVKDFFINYLVAKQLCDDAHDWEHDLKMSQATPITFLVDKAAQKHKIDIKNYAAIRKLFWSEVILKSSSLINKYLALAQKDLNKIKILDAKDNFQIMLDSIKKTADKAVFESKQVKEFLKHY